MHDAPSQTMHAVNHVEELTTAAFAAATAIPQVEPENATPVEVSALETRDQEAVRATETAVFEEPLRPVAEIESTASEESSPVPEPASYSVPEETPREAQTVTRTFAPSTVELPPDLQQVESDPDKIRAVREGAPEEELEPRPRRARPTSARVNDEPLVQVETGAPSVQPADSPANAPH